MAAEAATLADDLGFPQLSDRMERLSMRPFDPQKDVVSREDYDEFQRLYGPIKSIGLSPDGSPMVVVQKGGIDRMYQKDADAGWRFFGYAFKTPPKSPRGSDKGPFYLTRALGIPKGHPWAMFDRSGGPVVEHEKVHLSQFRDKDWEKTFKPMRRELDQLASKAKKDNVDIEGIVDKLSPYEVVARVAEVARAMSSRSQPPRDMDYVDWVHGRTTDTSPKTMTSLIIDILGDLPPHRIASLVSYDPRDLDLWKRLIPMVQQGIMSVYRIPRGYRGQITRLLRSDRSTRPSPPSSRGDTA
jgi:hypothetical protein